MAFKKATKKQAKGRIALFGPSGAGKTYTALTIARELSDGGRIAVIDTESGSASKYADEFDFDSSDDLPDFSPRSFVAAMQEAQDAGYAVIVIDSLSHAWMGRGGVLEIVDNATAASRSKNAFTTGWKEATPEHNRLIEALVGCRCHLIVTMRSKTEYVIDNANGKQLPRKVGLAPVQRDGMEYEFDIVGDMDTEGNRLVISKSRCKELSGKSFVRPDATLGRTIKAWLSDGAPILPTPAEHDAADPATEEQVIQLREMVAAGDAAKWKSYLSSAFGVEDVADLSATQAADIIGKARAKANGNHKPAMAGARG